MGFWIVYFTFWMVVIYYIAMHGQPIAANYARLFFSTMVEKVLYISMDITIYCPPKKPKKLKGWFKHINWLCFEQYIKSHRCKFIMSNHQMYLCNLALVRSTMYMRFKKRRIRKHVFVAHALSGCDTLSFIHGIGKKSVHLRGPNVVFCMLHFPLWRPNY